MPLPPDAIRVNTLWRRQQWCRRIGLTGLGVMVAGMGLGFAGLGMRFATVACAAGVVVAACGLVVGSVFEAMVKSAARGVSLERLGDAPIEAGERFGQMTVVIADDEMLHLSMGASPLLAGLHRLLGCLALLGLAAGLAVLALLGHAGHDGVWSLVGAGVAGAFFVARLPFAVRWAAGGVHEGAPGISMERVRWFFVRDTLTVAAADIAELKLNAQELTLVTRNGANITLLRTPRSVLGTWEKLRLVSAISRTLDQELPVTDVSRQLAVA
ncbi:MAG TPA: hypothetical protein VFF65_11295 [Phycisphaerales bacterium]|nr:hypothetical protein [Phycisphaerales bacterium]